AVRANLPERLERRLAVAAGLPQPSRADGADQEGRVDVGPADGALHVPPREALLHRLDLEPALANVFEVLGRPEEHVDQRPDERRYEPEHGRHPDEPWILDPPPRILVHPEGGGEPEHAHEEQREVSDHSPRAVTEEGE